MTRMKWIGTDSFNFKSAEILFNLREKKMSTQILAD